MVKLCLVAGARPNFMKVAPLIRAIEQEPSLAYRLVHTGQHYDREMNEVFFEELGIPAPDVNLNCGGGSHAQQAAKIMAAFEHELIDHRPDYVVVVGDVNSTMACAITAKKMGIKLVHVEAGLRSGDRSMPEEINRLVTDSISDLFFVTEPSAQAHLLREGHSPNVIHFVGHVMIDNLIFQAAKLDRTDCSTYASNALKQQLQDSAGQYAVVTLHRPSNVDDSTTLLRIASALQAIASELPIIFPVHPRTAEKIEKSGIRLADSIHLLRPLPYMEFLNLWRGAAVVLTDSGGLQEETTALGIPCVTIRANTERPITTEEGTNVLAGTQTDAIISAARRALTATPNARRPALWDGLAASRIVETLKRHSVQY